MLQECTYRFPAGRIGERVVPSSPRWDGLGTKMLNHQWKYLWLEKGVIPFLLTAINNTLMTYLKHKNMERTGELSFAALFREAGGFGY